MTTFRALRDITDLCTGVVPSPRVVETVDAVDEQQAAAILTRVGYAVLDVVDTDVLVTSQGMEGGMPLHDERM